MLQQISRVQLETNTQLRKKILQYERNILVKAQRNRVQSEKNIQRQTSLVVYETNIHLVSYFALVRIVLHDIRAKIVFRHSFLYKLLYNFQVQALTRAEQT